MMRVVIAGLVLFATVASADDRTADTQRLLGLLDGVRTTYVEAFDDDEGELIRPLELEEARLLLKEVRQIDEHLGLVDATSVAALDQELHGVVLGDRLPELIDGLLARVTAATGVQAETLPPAPPSVARGRALFVDNCATCHAADEAERRRMAAPDFKQLTFMRRETPRDFFTMLSLGRRKSAMPEWSQAFSVQQRWDSVAYVWTLAQSDAEHREAAVIYGAHCVGCHGSRGEGVTGQAPDLSRPGSLIDQTDRTLMTVLSRGRRTMPPFGATLDDRQRWLAVSHLRGLSLGGGGSLPAVGATPVAATVVPADPRGLLQQRGIDPADVSREIGEHMRHRFER